MELVNGPAIRVGHSCVHWRVGLVFGTFSDVRSAGDGLFFLDSGRNHTWYSRYDLSFSVYQMSAMRAQMVLVWIGQGF